MNMHSSEIEPGSRIPAICKACKAKILMIRTINGKWGPFNPTPLKPNGKRLLIFPDGRTAKEHERFELGHESHFATCPLVTRFRKRKQGTGNRIRGSGIRGQGRRIPKP